MILGESGVGRYKGTGSCIRISDLAGDQGRVGQLSRGEISPIPKMVCCFDFDIVCTRDG